MAPQPETRQAQRIDQVEEAVTELRKSMMDEVASAVSRAANEMQQTLVSQITSSLDQVTQKLQIRINRVRENNENLISEVTRRQDELQLEMRTTISSLKQMRNGSQAKMGSLGSQGDRTGMGAQNSTFGGLGLQGSNSRNKDKEKVDDNPGGGGGCNYGGNWRYRKLDLPQFDGTNPDGWLLRAERYFAFYKLTNEEKLEATVVGFDGDALLWYQWKHRRRPIRTWEDMRSLICSNFDHYTQAGTLCEQWLAVKQTGTVAKFKRQFIEMAAPLERIPENILMGHFVNGLNEDIRAEVRMRYVHFGTGHGSGSQGGRKESDP